MSNKSNADSNQGDSGSSSGPITAPQVDQTRSRAGNTVFKSGTLFLSSRGIGGWITWKKRWFILTRTSLVFFRSDPSILPQKGSDVNLTLGGIDLNSSGSVVVKEDKKLLTVLFPDGRDGRAFTLKAETSEDLQDWKIALENALAQAPSAALVMGQNGIFRNDPSESVDEATEQWSDRRPAKSSVVGRPILLALQDIDGAPTFLEKALRFIEQHGVKVEGILRQSADVDDVNRRVQEYEEGKIEFSEEEDAHLIADCIKHVLRALPSSPVPAACCNALLEACRADRGGRVNAMRTVIADIFPEPNRHLLQRILKMMQIVVLHKTENRMSTSAVSACMAPLLLRPLLAGDCELDSNFSIGGDGSVQLLQAAAAANHAQAIVITLLDEYENIFGDYNLHEDPVSPGLYSGSDESGSEGEELTDEDEMLEDDEDSQHDLDADFEDEGSTSGTISDRSFTVDDQDENKLSENSGSEFGSFKGGENFESNRRRPRKTQISSSQHEMSNGDMQSQCTSSSKVHDIESHESMEDDHALTSLVQEEMSLLTLNTKTKKKSNEFVPVSKRSNVWGRTSAKKNLSMESLDFNEEEIEIQKLEATKTDLQDKIASEVKENQVLHADLERRKKDLQERRLALAQDVARLQAQLRKERDLRATMETRLKKPLGRSTISPTIDDKIRADLEEIFQAEEEVVNLKKKAANLHWQLNQQNENNRGPVCASCGQPQQRANYQERQKDQEDVDVTVSVPLRDKSRNCEDALLRADDENRGKEQLVEEQPMDNGDSAGPSCLLVAAAPPSASSSSRRSSSKSEGTIPTASALSKLTTRLNFLKEKRTQIVNELQNIEISRGLENPLLVALPRTNPR